MASTAFLRPPVFRPPPPRLLTNSPNSSKQLAYSSSRKTQSRPIRCHIHHCPHSSTKLPRRLLKLLPFASDGESIETETETETETDEKEEVQDNVDGAVGVEDGGSEGHSSDVEEPKSAVIASLKSYKEALASNEETKVAEIETFLKSIEDTKIDLEVKLVALSEELSSEKDRVLRISADFENFRRRTERERLSLVTNAQGEVVENLFPILDNFERARAQIKVGNAGEEKINNSYQSIYKQFVEILGSLGVVPVETKGNPFDPMLHEAIMREESTEFGEDIVIEEYRKGFKLGDRLLRPSMVKVSAGPGPAKPASDLEEPSEVAETTGETTDDGSTEVESLED